jgi:hypothetical protein
MAQKKTAKKKRTSAGGGAASGIVRFKTGFPAGLRNAIQKRYGNNWHLSLQILDGDDGDGDDGDGDDGAAMASGLGIASGRGAGKSGTAGAAKKRSQKARKRTR